MLEGLSFTMSFTRNFNTFIDEVWFPIQVRGNNRKPKTIAFYESSTKLVKNFFEGLSLQEIKPVHIERYLAYLRVEYRGKTGNPLAPKTIRHHYSTLNLIFEYAERLELIERNPMARVPAPKKDRKPVEAFTQEQAKQSFTLAVIAWTSWHRLTLSLLDILAYQEQRKKGRLSALNL